MPPTPGLRGLGTWEPSSLPGLKRAGQMPSSPLLLLLLLLFWRTPLLASPVLPSAFFLCPQDQCGQGEGGTLEGRGPAWEFSRLPRPEWVEQSSSAPLLLLPEGPSHLPLLISQASGVLILSGLHFSSPLSPPTSYPFTWWFLPSPWASGSPTSGRQAP